MCIVDESHRFRNVFKKDGAPSEYTQWLEMLMKCKRLVYLTGTPLVSDVEVEWHGLERMMRVAPGNALDGRVFRYDPRGDVKQSHHFAATDNKVVRCPMTYAQALLYFANQRSKFALTVGGETYEVFRPVKNTYNSALRTAANNPFPQTPEASPKFSEMMRRMRAHHANGDKQLVYSERLESGINAMRDLWIAQMGKKNVFVIDGSQSADARTKAVRAFNRNGEPRVLFISDAASRGVDLQGVTAVHLLEPGERLQDERQVINRAVRFKSHKQKDARVAVYLYCSVFEPQKCADGPIGDVVKKLAMFGDAAGGGFETKLKAAIAKYMQREKTTVDERVIEAREKIDIGVQQALERLEKMCYRAPRPEAAPRKAVPLLLGFTPEAVTSSAAPKPSKKAAGATPRTPKSAKAAAATPRSSGSHPAAARPVCSPTSQSTASRTSPASPPSTSMRCGARWRI